MEGLGVTLLGQECKFSGVDLLCEDPLARVHESVISDELNIESFSANNDALCRRRSEIRLPAILVVDCPTTEFSGGVLSSVQCCVAFRCSCRRP